MADNEEEADNGMAITVDDVDDDAAMRAQAAVNSPKGDNGLSFNDDDDNENNNGMSLNLSDDINDEDDPQYDGKSTPNTKIRIQADINSPRAKTSQKWGADETDSSNNAVAGLMTQVSREDAEKQNALAGGMQDDDTERNIKSATDQSSGGMCACFSCLWSCCSGPQTPASVEMNDSSSPNNNNNNSALITETKKSEGSDATLLGSNSDTTKDDNNRENSVSSTDYSFKLLPPKEPRFEGKKCLVLDLDETLVHSSFKPIPKPDFIIPVEIDRVVHHVYVLKRPFVDEFMLRASKHYEIVIFTASLSKYADPLLDKLDIHNVISHRLFRESCVIHGTAYVKDMKRVGRPLKDTIIVDNSPPSYMFQPCNAVPCASWFDDKEDTQLLDFCPVIETTMKDIDDVRCLLDANNKSFRWLCSQANQPLSKYTVRNDKRNRNQ